MLTGSAARVWRLRKRHQYIDAEVRADEALSSVELRFLLNGELTYRRVWTTREEALAEAAGRRAELERQGWIEHW